MRGSAAERIALAAAVLGALGLIVGSFGAWGRAGSYTAPGIGGASDQGLRLYPGLDEIGGIEAFLVLAAGLLALAGLVAYTLRAVRAGMLVAVVASVLGLVFAIVGLLGVTGAEVGFGGADPTWGIIMALVGGVLGTTGSAALARSALAASRS